MSLRDKWKRIPWSVIALLGWSLAGAFGAVAAIQHIELDKRHLHVEFGNLAEWLAGVGSLAAFGALFYASREWRQSQLERRDQQADQARRVIAEPSDSRSYSQPPVHTWPVTVSNHSGAPVFNLHVLDPDEDSMLMHMGGKQVSRPVSQPVLQPGERTPTMTVIGVDATEQTPTTEFLVFEFTDANSRRWRRIGSREPVRLL
jgi:hypothetical protein